MKATGCRLTHLNDDVIKADKVLRLSDLTALLHILIWQELAQRVDEQKVALNGNLEADVG